MTPEPTATGAALDRDASDPVDGDSDLDGHAGHGDGRSVDGLADPDAPADGVDPTDLDGDVEATARELGAEIASLPAYRAFDSARTAVERDDQLQERIAAFERDRREFALARQTGDATQEDVEALRRAQEELHSNPTMAEFLDARERLRERLEAVNRAISAELAVDFGEEAGGCCQD